MTDRLQGVIVPLLTPFRADLTPDSVRAARLAKWVLAQGCAGVAPFLTTGEGASLAADERMTMLEQLAEAGVPAAKLAPGTGANALPEAVRLTAHAVKLGCAGVFVAPPYYYKRTGDESLVRFYAEVIERVGDERLALYLDNFPRVAGVEVSRGLVEALLTRYPATVKGLKDSSGFWGTTLGFIDQFARDGFAVFNGGESFMVRNVRHGGAGCTPATANINPAAIVRLYTRCHGFEAEDLQVAIDRLRHLVDPHIPLIPSLKAVIAHFASDPGWTVARPPLGPLAIQPRAELIARLLADGFDMPGVKQG